jgi:hypothetical protein
LVYRVREVAMIVLLGLAYDLLFRETTPEELVERDEKFEALLASLLSLDSDDELLDDARISDLLGLVSQRCIRL